MIKLKKNYFFYYNVYINNNHVIKYDKKSPIFLSLLNSIVNLLLVIMNILYFNNCLC